MHQGIDQQGQREAEKKFERKGGECVNQSLRGGGREQAVLKEASVMAESEAARAGETDLYKKISG